MGNLLMRRPLMVTANGGGASVLPSEYQQVQYVQVAGQKKGDGTTASNGIRFTSNIIAPNQIRVLVGFMCTKDLSQGQAVIGVTQSAGTNGWYVGPQTGLQRIFAYSGFYPELDYDTPLQDTRVDVEAVFDKTNGFISIADGTKSDSATGTTRYWNSQHVSLFGQKRGNNVISYQCFEGRVYYAKLYNNNTNELVLDAYPCYRKSDGVIGFYELVTNDFITASGNVGTVSAGPNV